MRIDVSVSSVVYKLFRAPAKVKVDWLDGSRTIPHFPYSRNADFVGCEDVIEKMNSLSRKDNRLALNGIGGVG